MPYSPSFKKTEHHLARQKRRDAEAAAVTTISSYDRPLHPYRADVAGWKTMGQ